MSLLHLLQIRPPQRPAPKKEPVPKPLFPIEVRATDAPPNVQAVPIVVTAQMSLEEHEQNINRLHELTRLIEADRKKPIPMTQESDPMPDDIGAQPEPTPPPQITNAPPPFLLSPGDERALHRLIVDVQIAIRNADLHPRDVAARLGWNYEVLKRFLAGDDPNISWAALAALARLLNAQLTVSFQISR